MKISLHAKTVDDIPVQIAQFMRRSAAGERAFAETTNRGVAKAMYAAAALERLADQIADITVVLDA